ncbi:hypothetical protein [Blastococcus sp. VKM Ac-2987]|nr:hypothetical protein [Blastococcus sp. VKM Ac-2987]MCZ2857840.1 hypothetical protein [Blastococcus sp. VKM Ac-2987]
MGDKSPRQSMTKAGGKSIKEKRLDRKAKGDPTPPPEIVARGKKR